MHVPAHHSILASTSNLEPFACAETMGKKKLPTPVQISTSFHIQLRSTEWFSKLGTPKPYRRLCQKRTQTFCEWSIWTNLQLGTPQNVQVLMELESYYRTIKSGKHWETWISFTVAMLMVIFKLSMSSVQNPSVIPLYWLVYRDYHNPILINQQRFWTLLNRIGELHRTSTIFNPEPDDEFHGLIQVGPGWVSPQRIQKAPTWMGRTCLT